MRYILIVGLFCNISFAASNFEILLNEYHHSSMPNQEQLRDRDWVLVKMYSNPALALNKDKEDYTDENGIKNYDGSQMIWRFVGYNHPRYQFTLSKINFLKANQNRIGHRVRLVEETQSMQYGFSAYTSNDRFDIYYIQNCRLSSDKRLICPATLHVTPAAIDLYKDSRLIEANNEITVIQEFLAQ